MRSLQLLYHELRPAKSRYSYVTPCDEFEAHCEVYTRLREQASDSLLLPGITFDDGHRSDLIFAAPTLARHGLHAAFFITAGWTGERPGYMDWDELRELQKAGHTIGAHGMSHKLLTSCTPTELDRELRGARLKLEDGLGVEVRTMSLPGGRENIRVLNACRAAGYEQVFTSLPRAEEMGAHPGNVGRLNLVAGTSVEWLERVLDTRSGALARLERTARVKAAARRLFGDRLYAKLWAVANRQESDAAEAEAPAS